MIEVTDSPNPWFTLGREVPGHRRRRSWGPEAAVCVPLGGFLAAAVACAALIFG